MAEVTQILSAIDAGDPAAAKELLPLVYDELRRLAAAQMAQEKPGHTLNATALVHEVWLRLVGDRRRAEDALPEFATRRHFFAAAAEAMRRILIEAARRKRRLKRGGGMNRVHLHDLPMAAPAHDVLALDEALTALGKEDPLKAELVKLRFFAGLSVEEAGRCLGYSRATADRHWAFARAWLHDFIQRADS